MNMRAPSTDLIGIGLYTVGDAARLLRTPARTVRRWLAGYDYRRDGERHHVAPLWEPDLHHPEDGVELSFRDLIELRFVRAFTGIGLDLRTIRACLEAARTAIECDRLFWPGPSNRTGPAGIRNAAYLSQFIREILFKSVRLAQRQGEASDDQNRRPSNGRLSNAFLGGV